LQGWRDRYQQQTSSGVPSYASIERLNRETSMRVSTQVSFIAVVGALGYAAYVNWATIKPLIPASLGGGPVQTASVQPGPPSGAPGGGQAPGGQQQAAQAGGQRPPGQGGPPGAGGPGGPGGAPLVEVSPATVGTITETAESVGTTRALESVVITTRVSGIVEAVLFQEGQTVTRGQELVRFDMAERQAELEAARAAIETARAQREEVATRLERARALRTTGAGTDAQVSDLTGQLRTSDTNIVAARARERAASARLDDLVLRAPFAGRVGVRSVSVGALVEPRAAVTTLDDLSQMRLDFSIPEALLSNLKEGAQLRTQTIAFGNRVFAGRVAVIDTRIDPVTRSVRMTGLIDNADNALRPGMFMNVTMDVAVRQNAVTIPEEALVGEGPRQIVFVVKDGRVERRQVRTGQRSTGRVEIAEGVAAGEMVIARGTQRVRHGIPVTARPVSAAPAGGAPAGGPPTGRGPGTAAPGAVPGATPGSAPAAAPAGPPRTSAQLQN
jgi:membrane fusion protein, multidrug efflux system